MKFSWENFRGAFCLKDLNNAVIRNLYIKKYSWKNFCGTLENHEKRENLAQWIFPSLRYAL